MSNVLTDIQIVDNVFVKMHCFPNIGDTHEGHAHTFDHITLLSSGKVLMEHCNGDQEFEAPHMIVTPKGVKHQFTSLMPNTIFFCIHAIRNGNHVDDVAPQNLTSEQQTDLLNKYKIVEINSNEDI